MKRLLFLVLSLAIAMSAAACSKTTTEAPSTKQTLPPSSSATATEPTEDATPSEPVEDSKPTAPSEPVEDSKPTTPSEPVEDTNPTVPSEPVETVPCSHAFEASERQDSTCTKTGYIQYTCKLCGKTETSQLQATGHLYLDPTCTEPKRCRACGETSGKALGHDFQIQSQVAPGCVKNGSITYSCRLCQYTYTQATAATGHSYTEATCLSAKKCSSCDAIDGKPLGHQYGDDSLCVRCGAENPDKPAQNPDHSFTLTIRGKGIAIAGITVSVYVDNSSVCAGSSRTDAKGKAVIPLTPGSSYKVILSDVPQGFDYQESYTFSGLTANINLTVAPVLDPNDHGQANYQEGSTMADFTLTDIKGNCYTLSELLKTKNVVILNFWFSACGPCVSEFPHFEEFYKNYSKDVQLLALNHIDDEATIRRFQERTGFTFPMIYENLGMGRGFNLVGYPTTVVIGQNMKILSIHLGAFNRDDVKALFETYAS